MRRNFRTVLVAAAACLFGMACSETGSGTGPLPVLKHDPILFIPGYGGSGADWQNMKTKFLNDGWQDVELYAYTYSFLTSNASTAADIRDDVNNIIKATG